MSDKTIQVRYTRTDDPEHAAEHTFDVPQDLSDDLAYLVLDGVLFNHQWVNDCTDTVIEYNLGDDRGWHVF